MKSLLASVLLLTAAVLLFGSTIGGEAGIAARNMERAVTAAADAEGIDP